jgi:hypothetical protein
VTFSLTKPFLCVKFLFRKRTLERKTMGLDSDGEVNGLPRGNLLFQETPGLVSSLNEAWFHTLDRCVFDTPLCEVILPLMRNCFFGGAMYAVHLLQNGHGDQLVSDIAGFIMEEPQW